MGWQLAVLLTVLVAVAAGEGQDSTGAAHKAGSRLSDAILQQYFSQEELGAYLDEFTSRCGSISRKFSIGKSVADQDLWVLEVSDQPGNKEAEPNFVYVGNMHGDEPSGRQLLLMFAEWLCSSNGKDGRATRIIRDMHTFIMPTMNPDGFAMRQRNNKNNVDLNRDFPDPIMLKGSDLRRPKSTEQPEVLAMMNWTLSTGFTAGANLHEGAVVANYPFDGYPDKDLTLKGVKNPSPDDDAFVYLAMLYARKHKWMTAPHNKEFAKTGGITNGAQWYPLYGGMQDWTYLAGGCLELTLELTDQKWRPAQDLPTLWDENKEALVELPLVAALGGIRGRVMAGMKPLPAVIGIKGNTRASAARSDNGYFSRPLAPGKYTLSVSHAGYQTKEVAVVVPSTGQGTVLQVELVPVASAAANASTADTGSSASHAFHTQHEHATTRLQNARYGAYIIAVHIGILGTFGVLYVCSTMRSRRPESRRQWSPVG